MTENEKKPTGLLHSTEKLRKLILDNPDLPLLVFAGEDANSGEYSYQACASVVTGKSQCRVPDPTPRHPAPFHKRSDPTP